MKHNKLPETDYTTLYIDHKTTRLYKYALEKILRTINSSYSNIKGPICINTMTSDSLDIKRSGRQGGILSTLKKIHSIH